MPASVSACRGVGIVVCHSPFPAYSGGRKRSVRLMEAMASAGLQPLLVIPESPSEACLEEVERRGWLVEHVASGRPNVSGRVRKHLYQEPARHDRALSQRLRGVAESGAFVQLEEYRAVQYFSSVPAHIPVVLSAHNVDSQVFRASAASVQDRRQRFSATYYARRLATTEKRAARRATATLCVTEHDAEYFRRQGARDSVIVPNGVDDELLAAPAAPAGSEQVLFFGSFFWRPNLTGAERFLNQVWPRVIRRHPAARLRVAGMGSVKHLRPIAQPIQGVEVVGVVPDLRQELEAARVVVAPIWVGGGTRIKVLEALAAARPVIGPHVAVERIGFTDGTHGFITDDADDFASAIVRVLEDDDLAARLCRGARELGEQFRWSECTRPAVELYKRLAAATSSEQVKRMGCSR